MFTYSTALILFNNPQYKVAPTPSIIEYNRCMAGVDHSENMSSNRQSLEIVLVVNKNRQGVYDLRIFTHRS